MIVGLCEGCRHTQIVESARGSRFYLCTLSRVDPSFPKYPELPVLACTGYQQKDATLDIRSDSSSVRFEPQPEDE